MSAFLRATWIFFEAHLWRVFRTRRGWIALLLALIPVALATFVKIVSSFEGPVPTEGLLVLVWFLTIQTIVPLVAMLMSSSVVAEEIEDRTITYLFTRPSPRGAILIGRWLAVALPIAVILCGAAELVMRILHQTGGGEELVVWAPAGFHWRYVATVFLGGVVYSGLFAAVGTLVKRPMIVGLAYVFLYEGVLGNFPGSSQESTVIFYLKSFLFDPFPNLASELNDAILSSTLTSPAAAAQKLLLILVVGLALGTWRFAKREYVLAA